MKIFSQLFIFPSLLIAGFAHGIHLSRATINQFKSIIEPENLYTGGSTKETSKSNFPPLDYMFEKTVISKRSDKTAMDAADKTFFQQLGNALIGS